MQVGYGMAKAATHHMASSLADSVGKPDGLPKEATVAVLLPNVIDTPANRLAMPTGAPHKITLRIFQISVLSFIGDSNQYFPLFCFPLL